MVVSAVLMFLLELAPAVLCAAPPNVVLSRALHFSSSEGTSITLDPGRYLIEQAGPSELRLTPEGGKPSVIIHAESLTHEQYELFSPMALTRPQKDEGYLIELLLPGGIRLEAKGSIKAPTESPKTASTPPISPHPPMVQESQIEVSPPSPAFIPSHPSLEENMISAPSTPDALSLENSLTYRAPGPPSQDTRVIVDEQESGKEPLYLAVLSPDHIGLTMFEQPALFWYIAQSASQPVDVRITDEGSTHVLLDVRMLPPIRQGIHKVEMKDYGIRLQPNTTYQWTIILRGNAPGEDYTTSGWIMRISPPQNVAAVVHLPSITSLRPRSLVEAGLWYDAIWVLSERIQAQPTDTTALNQRATLFEQVGLIPPAQLDRAHLHLP